MRGYPVGTVRTWNGQQYQKQGDGTWTPVKDGARHPGAALGEQREEATGQLSLFGRTDTTTNPPERRPQPTGRQLPLFGGPARQEQREEPAPPVTLPPAPADPDWTAELGEHGSTLHTHAGGKVYLDDTGKDGPRRIELWTATGEGGDFVLASAHPTLEAAKAAAEQADRRITRGEAEPKERKRTPAQATLDEDDPNSPNYRWKDTGLIAGARKFDVVSYIRAAAKNGHTVSSDSIDWKELEQNPREAKALITKSNLFGQVDWSALREAGMDPGAGFLVDRVYASIAPEPEDDPAKRQDYAKGVESARARLESCRTVDQVIATLGEMQDEMRGTVIPASMTAEYQQLKQQRDALREAIAPYEEEDQRLSGEWTATNTTLGFVRREQERRTRRGWRPDPELASQIKALEAEQEQRQAAREAHQQAHPEFQEKEHKDYRRGGSVFASDNEWEQQKISERMYALRQQAERENAAGNPLTRAWKALGPRFVNLLNRKSASFASHRASVRSGEVTGWSWAEKERATGPRETKKKARFQMRVADKLEPRQGGAKVDVRSAQSLKDTFGLRDVQSGNWVLDDPTSAQWHMQSAGEALTDLASLLGTTPERVAMNGRLAIAFGARGHGNAGWGGAAAAHYEPRHRVINITKQKGGGSLGHEWFHALDNLIAEHHGSTTGEEDFATSSGDVQAKLPPELRSAVQDLHKAMHEGSRRITGTMHLTASDRYKAGQLRQMAATGWGASSDLARQIIEAKDASSAFAVVEAASASRLEERRKLYGDPSKKLKPKDARRYEEWGTAAVAFHTPAGTDTVQLAIGEPTSDFAAEAQLLESENQHYWSKPEEMAARAFSSWCEDRLAGQGRKSQYLAVHADNKGYIFGEKPYPEGEERTRINAAFDKLFATMRQLDTLKKALDGLEGRDALVKADTEDGRWARLLAQPGERRVCW